MYLLYFLAVRVFRAVCGLPWLRWVGASLVSAHWSGLCISSSQAELPCGMWNLPRPEMEPMSPALAGGLLTSGPSGSPNKSFFRVTSQISSQRTYFFLTLQYCIGFAIYHEPAGACFCPNPCHSSTHSHFPCSHFPSCYFPCLPTYRLPGLHTVLQTHQAIPALAPLNWTVAGRSCLQCPHGFLPQLLRLCLILIFARRPTLTTWSCSYSTSLPLIPFACF